MVANDNRRVLTNDDIQAVIDALTLQYGMVFSAIAENTQILLTMLDRLDSRHADDVARRVNADELIARITQTITAGSTALAIPDHSPTDQDTPQIMRMLHQIVYELGRQSQRLDALETKVTPSRNSTLFVPDKNTPENTPFQGQTTPAPKSTLFVPEHLVPERQGQTTPASQAGYTTGVDLSGTNSGTGTKGVNHGVNRSGTKGVELSGTKNTPLSGTGTKSVNSSGTKASGTKGVEWQEAQRAKIAAYEVDHPGATVREIADAIGISKSSVDRLRKK